MKIRGFKSVMATLTAFTLTSTMFGCLTASAEDVSTVKGDLNLDGQVSIADVILINKYMADMVDLNQDQLANGDCLDDSKGEVNTLDSLAILQLLGGQIESLPVVVQEDYDVPFTSQIITNSNSEYDQKATLINTYEEYEEFIKQTDINAIEKYAEGGVIIDNSQITYPEYDESFFSAKSVVIEKITMNYAYDSMEVSSVSVTDGTLNTAINYGVNYPNSSQCALVGVIIAIEMDKEYVPENITNCTLTESRFWDEEYLKTAPITVYDPMNDPDYEGTIEDGLEFVYTDTEAMPGYSMDIYLPNKRAELVTVTFTDTGDVYTLKEVMQNGWVTARRMAAMAPQTLVFCWVDPITGEWINWEE